MSSMIDGIEFLQRDNILRSGCLPHVNGSIRFVRGDIIDRGSALAHTQVLFQQRIAGSVLVHLRIIHLHLLIKNVSPHNFAVRPGGFRDHDGPS